MKTKWIVLITLGTLVGGCTLCIGATYMMNELGYLPTRTPTQTSTITLTPTNTPIPSLTKTNTPEPTPTMTSEPTDTPIPTISTTPWSQYSECIPSDTDVESAIVIGIVDGDTISVQFGDGSINSLRYIGIDAPETGDAIYQQATNFNSELVAWKEVALIKDVSQTDKYDRLLRYVIVGGKFVNYELIRNGFAFAIDYPPDSACAETFRQAEQQARNEKVGLWAIAPSPDPGRITPISPPNGEVVCDCSSNKYNCSEFFTYIQAQACFNYCVSIGAGDIHWLDGDDDGIACERLR